ncbi:peptidoglycan recognition protein family protein [Brachybacterium hainanense]|uniref:N-acetylmuramoyl-L-alanine amidase n=1 Tax=Brachybacterium hainanense TaxID=1541174 RepID=A0ABV6R9A9_9MICO
MALAIDTSKTSPNRSRSKLRPQGIVIHHWDDPRKHPTFGGVVSWFMNSRAKVSAHYVVESGRVARMVPEDQRAWHAKGGNSKYLGIECNPRQSDADYETIGALVADIWRRHGVLPLIRHRAVKGSSTDCPGTYDLARIEAIARRHLGGGSGTSAPGGSAVKPSGGKVAVDDRYGRETHSEVQRRLGQPVDGRLGKGDLAALCRYLGLPVYTEISDQPRTAAQIGNAIVPAIWDYDPAHTGPRSKIVRHLEAVAGATVDRGGWGPGLTGAIQRSLNADSKFLTAGGRPAALARIKAAGLL